MNQALREIPKVDRLIDEAQEIHGSVPRPLVALAVRRVVERVRGRVREEALAAAEVAGFFAGDDYRRDLAAEVARQAAPRHREVINATGVLLHTGLGRAPLAAEALEALRRVAGYAVVEVDPDSGRRGRREEFVRDLLVELTGAEEATVVNNNAGAVLLLLRGLAEGREVIVSRGELVEIGGGFRVPDVMTESGARLVEVGTTNRTRVADFERVLGPDTALLLQVHTSNFRIVGFTEAPSITELAALGRRRGVPVAADLGSGLLRRLPQLPFAAEPPVRESLAEGADVVTASGDKMLGGPQCGLLLGRRELIGRLRDHPLFRALRPDKLVLAALEATLLLWRAAGDDVPLAVPFYRRMTAPLDELRQRAESIRGALGVAAHRVRVVDSQAQVGSGSVPGREFPSVALAIDAAGGEADRMATALRRAAVPVFCRVTEGLVLLDLRTVAEEDDDRLEAALVTLLSETPSDEATP